MTINAKTVLGLLAAFMLMVPLGGCSDKGEKGPKGKTLPATVMKIDQQTRNVTIKIKTDDGGEREESGTVGDDTEILINGRGAKLADVQVGEEVSVTVQKSPTEDGKYLVKKVVIERAAENDFKPTSEITPSAPPANSEIKPSAPPSATEAKPTEPRAQLDPTQPVPVPTDTGEEDPEARKQDLMDLIYAQIRVRMEEALVRRAELLKNGTPQTDASVADFERQIIRARTLLTERGEILEDVSPPLAGVPAPSPSASAAPGGNMIP